MAVLVYQAAMLIHHLESQKLVQPPKWLADNTAYITVMGSTAYGVSNDMSDMDCYGFCLPPKDMTFPHLAGEIPGFGRQIQRFEVWNQHHIIDPSDQREYDFAIYSIVKFFQLCMENNPNMVDTLFTAPNMVLHRTAVADIVRDNRKMFLHKGSFHKFKGYAYAQLGKLKAKKQSENPKRAASIEAHGYDVKAGYHVVRLALEAEQILTEGDLDLTRNAAQLRAIRNGEWSMERLETFFADKERHLEDLKNRSSLPDTPDEDAIKEVLMNCLEQHYGDLSAAVQRQTPVDLLKREMQTVLDRYS
jgi:uncharacterized protein